VAASWRRRHAFSIGADGHGDGFSVPAEQVAALTALYTATNGANWTRNANWLTGDPCDPERPWYGVSCARVTERTLPNLWNYTVPATQNTLARPAGMARTTEPLSALPPAVDGVTALHLASNNLVGTLPVELGVGLRQTLQYLDLHSNMLTGEIPQSLLLGLPKLHTLYIEPKVDELQWRLRGMLPAAMGSATGLPNLRYLGLSRNQLTGPIPASFGQLPCHVTSASGWGHEDPSARGEVGCVHSTVLFVGGNDACLLLRTRR
jgi:hypothetical protein